MAQCPNCQSSVPDDFGLIECAKCGAALFVEFDGRVTAQAEAIESQEDDGLAPDVPYDFAPPEEYAPEEHSQEQQVVPQSIETTASPAATSAEHMDELKDFANSTLSQGREGLLRVNLFISGIDTADLRNLVYEALLDKKFLWDAESLIKSIASGRLQIQDLPSVKAAVLLSRLKSIPVHVSWEQHAIHQA